MNVLERILLKSTDVKTDGVSNFFVRCRRTDVLNSHNVKNLSYNKNDYMVFILG